MKILVALNLCFGYSRGLSPLYCDRFHETYKKIIEVSQQFNQCLIVNDHHSPQDGEFSFLPKHCVSGSHDCMRFPHLELQIQTPTQFLTKRTLSAFRNDHNLGVLFAARPSEIHLAGFSTSIDLVPTALDLLQLHQKVIVNQELTNDISPEFKIRGLDYLGQFIQVEKCTTLSSQKTA